MHPAHIWELTPCELGLFFEGYAEEKAERSRELIYLAWHIEAFARQKRLPSLKKILKGNTREKTVQNRLSTQQLIKIARSKELKVPAKWR